MEETGSETPNEAPEDKSANFLAAALSGDAPKLRDLAAKGVTPEMDKQAVMRAPCLDLSAVDVSFFRLLNLHPANEKLNVPLYLAAYYGKAAAVDALLEQNNAQRSLDIALAAAAIAGNAPLAQKLLDAGADVSFEDHAALGEAVAGPNPALLSLLQKNVTDKSAANARALRACIEAGKLDAVPGYLAPGVDAVPALRALCPPLCTKDPTAVPMERQDMPSMPEYLDTLDMLLAFCEAGGADMKKLAEDLLDDAVAHVAAPVANRLLAFGADANRVMVFAVENGQPELLVAALEAGAEPRRFRGVAFDIAARPAASPQQENARAIVRMVLKNVTARRLQEEAETLAAVDAGFSPALLARVLREETGETGLMLAAVTDRAQEALALLEQNPQMLTADVLLQADRNGWSVLERFCDGGHAARLLDEKLWRGRPQEFAKIANAVFGSTPQDKREALAEILGQGFAALKADETRRRLQDRAEKVKNRFRLK
ncbi:MAG: hypothetical protein GC185_07820 [Alphaproteobacteria bacterium]|nr:hypothetical protein [Alphaproteobacteria bacterium]